MALEDRIRSSVDTALGDLTARLATDVRAMIQQLVTAAREERDEMLAVVRRETLDREADDTQRQIEDAEARVRTTIDEAVNEARADERTKAAGREASRSAVFVLRNARLLGWKLSGFGSHDAQPKAIDLGLDDSGVIGQAVAAARLVTTSDSHASAAGPGFVNLPSDRMGFAVPVIMGGRVVAVVHADSVAGDERPPVVPNVWPEVIEILSRHAARCLEALAVQKAASAPSPRSGVPSAARPTPAGGLEPV